MLPLALVLTLLSADAPRLLTGVSAVGESVGVRAAAASQVFRQRLEPPAYVADERAVTNWRREAAHELDPMPLSALAALFQLDRPIVTRCVKLNNYWCIKSARWNGEVGSDEEGHTGFASAEQGADAAATLLRRYYLEFGRRSALDVVRRWAPAECRTVVAGIALPTVLAVRGIGATLRARWLAGRRASPAPRIRVAAAGKAIPAPRRAPQTLRASAVPMRPLPAFRMPDIAVGIGERKVVTISAALAPRAPMRRQPTPASVAAAAKAMAARRAAQARQTTARPAARTFAAAPKPVTRVAAPVSPRPAGIPGPDGRLAPSLAGAAPCRLLRSRRAAHPKLRRPHRARAGLGPNDDLRLFDDDGRPLPNLTRVMLAMSSVELGMLRASASLVQGAVARAALRAQAADASSKTDGGAIPTPPI